MGIAAIMEQMCSLPLGSSERIALAKQGLESLGSLSGPQFDKYRKIFKFSANEGGPMFAA